MSDKCQHCGSDLRIMQLERRLSAIRKILETAVCTEEPDDGVILLSDFGPTHPEIMEDGKTAQVYDHAHFSPLGDALIAAWELTNSE